jgi:putative ABC transport system substrate-binding protein
MTAKEPRSRNRAWPGRRSVVSGLASAVLLSGTARAQREARPVVGFLHSASPETANRNLEAFRDALAQAGYREDKNVTILYRWAESRYDRLNDLVAELVDRRVSVLVAMGASDGPRAAKRATTSIPIVFGIGGDPIDAGLVANLNPQSGNVTGSTFFSTPLGPKRLEILRELLGGIRSAELMINPDNVNAKAELSRMSAAARELGLDFSSLNAISVADYDAALGTAAREKIGAIVVMTDALFNNTTEQLVAAAARHAVPTMYFLREFVTAGGLISYGASIINMYRQVGDYVGRILSGARPADLPVVQPTKFELAINISTVKTLGLAVPSSLLALADEVIE